MCTVAVGHYTKSLGSAYTYDAKYTVSVIAYLNHVSPLLTACLSSMCMLCVLHDHGLPFSSLQNVFCATVTAKITYCAPVWSGLCLAKDHLPPPASDVDNVLVTPWWLLYCSMQLTRHCLSEFLTVNYMYSSHYYDRRLTSVTICAHITTIDS